MEETLPVKPGFLDRKVRFKWPLYFIVVLILAGLVLYGVMSWQAAIVKGRARDMIRSEIRSKGEAIAETIAITSRDDIRNGNFDKLQEYFSDLVKQKDLQYIIVMQPNGQAVVHTNSRYRGTLLKDDLSGRALEITSIRAVDVKDQGLYDVAVPVMSFTRRAAIVRVGISYNRANQAFE
ncbi:MAG: hypothetical protein ABFD46_06945 [Armatimonadota bacterium]